METTLKINTKIREQASNTCTGFRSYKTALIGKETQYIGHEMES